MVKKRGRSDRNNTTSPDISNKSVVMMLVLVIVISLLSFIFYFDALGETAKHEVAQVTIHEADSLQASGRASIEIVEEGAQKNR